MLIILYIIYVVFKLQIQREVEKHSEENCYSFTWKITSYGEALRNAKSGEEIRLWSSAFYSCGYKCKLLLFPNGHVLFIISTFPKFAPRTETETPLQSFCFFDL